MGSERGGRRTARREGCVSGGGSEAVVGSRTSIEVTSMNDPGVCASRSCGVVHPQTKSASPRGGVTRQQGIKIKCDRRWCCRNHKKVFFSCNFTQGRRARRGNVGGETDAPGDAPWFLCCVSYVCVCGVTRRFRCVSTRAIEGVVATFGSPRRQQQRTLLEVEIKSVAPRGGCSEARGLEPEISPVNTTGLFFLRSDGLRQSTWHVLSGSLSTNQNRRRKEKASRSKVERGGAGVGHGGVHSIPVVAV